MSSEIIQSGEQKEKRMKKNEESLHQLWIPIKKNRLCIIVVLERRETDKGAGSLFQEMVAEDSPNTGRIKHACSRN